MKFIVPVFVLATLSQAAKQGDYDSLTEVVRPLVKEARCALPCVLSSLNKARSHRRGESIISILCSRDNRREVTRSADTCLERRCNLGGIAPLVNTGLGFACKHPEILSGKNHFDKRDNECAQCKQECKDSACKEGDDGGDDDGGAGCALCVTFCETICAIDAEE